jgi:hypothetical protein
MAVVVIEIVQIGHRRSRYRPRPAPMYRLLRLDAGPAVLDVVIEKELVRMRAQTNFIDLA